MSVPRPRSLALPRRLRASARRAGLPGHHGRDPGGREHNRRCGPRPPRGARPPNAKMSRPGPALHGSRGDGSRTSSTSGEPSTCWKCQRFATAASYRKRQEVCEEEAWPDVRLLTSPQRKSTSGAFRRPHPRGLPPPVGATQRTQTAPGGPVSTPSSPSSWIISRRQVLHSSRSRPFGAAPREVPASRGTGSTRPDSADRICASE